MGLNYMGIPGHRSSLSHEPRRVRRRWRGWEVIFHPYAGAGRRAGATPVSTPFVPTAAPSTSQGRGAGSIGGSSTAYPLSKTQLWLGWTPLPASAATSHPPIGGHRERSSIHRRPDVVMETITPSTPDEVELLEDMHRSSAVSRPIGAASSRRSHLRVQQGGCAKLGRPRDPLCQGAKPPGVDHCLGAEQVRVETVQVRLEDAARCREG